MFNQIMMLRLFIAMLFPEEVKTSLGNLINDLKPRGNGIKWVNPDNIHLTLKFLGDTDEKLIEPICQAMRIAVKNIPSFEIHTVDCGGFPNLNKPRVLWAGLKQAQPAIEMANSINEELYHIGIEKDKRRLSPHLTLGRVKKPGDLSGLITHMKNLNFDAGKSVLNRIALIKSTLSPNGPIYNKLKEIKLEP